MCTASVKVQLVKGKGLSSYIIASSIADMQKLISASERADSQVMTH